MKKADLKREIVKVVYATGGISVADLKAILAEKGVIDSDGNIIKTGL